MTSVVRDVDADASIDLDTHHAQVATAQAAIGSALAGLRATSVVAPSPVAVLDLIVSNGGVATIDVDGRRVNVRQCDACFTFPGEACGEEGCFGGYRALAEGECTSCGKSACGCDECGASCAAMPCRCDREWDGDDEERDVDCFDDESVYVSEGE